MAGYLISKNKADCSGCGACVQKCHCKAISLVEDAFGFAYPSIDGFKCTHCHLCETVCPVDNEKLLSKPSSSGNCVGGFSKDFALREDSSSGGFFTGIVKAFWQDGAVVFGAEQLPDLSVVHGYAESLDGVARFRKSKYAPSVIGDSYSTAKRFLDEGRKVIFSGTPCQIAGLLMYLGKRYDNLLAVDVVCHGYFAPLYMRKEREYYENKFASRAVALEYRDKKGGHWRSDRVRWLFANGKCKTWKKSDAPYMRIWLKHIIRRPSCEVCRFAFADRQSDISLGDYWHISENSPMFGGDYGTSVALGNTEKGKRVLQMLAGDYVLEEVDRAAMCRYKFALHGPTGPNPKASAALDDLVRLTYKSFLKKYLSVTIKDRIRNLKKGLSKIIRRLSPVK